MASRATPPTPAPTRGRLARLVHFSDLIGGGKSGHARRPWLMESVSWGGVGLSAILATVGVLGLVGLESPLARVGSGILVGGTLLTEVAAARLPVHAQRRFQEGAWMKGAAVVLGFGALTAWNVIAGHFGMVAIDSASVNDARAPLERAAAEADAERETAEEALIAFDAETRLQSEQMGLALRGAFESGYVTSAARNARESAEARAERRMALSGAVAETRARDRAAERALEAAPSPRPDIELWLFSLILELCKGALVWFATAGERRLAVPRTAKGGMIHFGVTNAIAKCNIGTMSPAERRELKSRCASLLATLRHMEAARA